MAAVSSGTFLYLLLFLAIPPTVSGGCPPSLFFDGVPENVSVGTVLFNTTDAVLNRLENNAGPIGLKTTVEGASVQRYSLYIASQLDFETMPNNIQNYVYCTDSTNVQAIRLEVTLFITDVNEFPPGFKDAPYSISIPEDTPIGSSVFQLLGRVSDNDTKSQQIFLYRIVNGSGQFVTDSAATGVVLLNTTLDFELGPRQYVLTLSAEEYQTPDGSPPKTSYTTLTIKVTDVDEFGPVFNSDVYTLSIAEQIYTGGVYNTDPPLRAVDDDATKENIIITTDNSTSLQVRSHFSVLANGSLVVIGNVTRGQYSLNVRAYQINRPADRMNVASVLITVFDINDHAPVMSSATYTVRIPEDASPGAIIATVFASDADAGENSSFSFYLSDNSIFTISTENAVGVVKLVGRLDRESNSSFTVQVYAQEDKSVEKFRSNNSTLVINVTDVNDNNPVFVNTTYSFSVPQTAAKGQEIGQVKAADKDAGPNGQVSYRLSGAYGIEEGTFVVDSATGRVVLSRNLTKRDVGVAVLAIEAYDGATEGERRSSMAQVQVKITSVNLSPPVFNSSTYTFTVLETSPVGFRVGAVAASDMDNDSLLYTLNNDTDFQLQGNPPALYVKSVLDLDSASRGSVYVLKVQVTDGDYSSTATVSVTVEHVNEYEPVLNQTVYTFQVLENATSGSFVQKITASDKDSGNDGTVMYSISPGVGPFIINPSTGVLTISCSTLSCLDYESETQYVIIVKATDGGQPARTSAATIIITVIDCNDEKPQFASNFTGSVTENLPPGFTILRLQASDLDTPEKDLVFSLSSVVPPGVLRVDNLYVVTNVSLDAEKTRVITGLVHVSDGLHTSTASLSISVQDVNDNAPQVVFTVNPVEIPEKAMTGAKVLVVNATDADVTNSGFTFWLEGAEGKFAIDHTTGTITVSGAFDRRVQNHYNVQVWVSDQGAPPRLNHSVLYINVTDSNTPPTFVNISNSSVTRYRFDVREDAPVGFSVGRVLALDPDPGSSGQVRYVISTGNSDHVFLLGETTGDLTLAKWLDFESVQLYSFVVEAVDNSLEPRTATATVDVSVVNVVEAPAWPASLPIIYITLHSQCAGTQPSDRLQDVMVVSSNSQSDVTYSLTNHPNLFSIDNVTGLLRAHAALLTLSAYQVGLRACAVGNKTACSDAALTVRVETNDAITFCPPFLVVHVSESASVGYVITDLNTTKGDDHVTYSFSSSTFEFGLGQSSGVVSLVQRLDRERTDQYILQVVAVYVPTNTSVTAQVTIIVDDAPDSPPIFTQKVYEGEINENTAFGNGVRLLGSRGGLKISASDPDLNSSLTYYITKDNSEGAFLVSRLTGEITVNHSVDLEAMETSLNGSFTLQVLVSDGYFNDTATVMIHVVNVNDNPPRFSPDTSNLTLSENSAVPLVVISLNATDNDPGDSDLLTYSLLPDDDSLPFTIDTNRKRLLLMSELDREKVAFYTFSVIAKDPGGLNGSLVINAVVGDDNDQPPIFEKSTYRLSVVEGAAGIGQSLVISAHDNDIGDNARLTYSLQTGNENNSFSISTINSSQAVVRVEKPLDRERVSSMRLEVIAKDGGQKSLTGTCTIEVTIEDINDNPPRFVSSVYNAVISEDATNNTRLSLVPSLQVIDEDAGTNGSSGVVFSLETGSNLPFYVDSITGDIHVLFTLDSQHLDWEKTSSYILKLVATDDRGQGLSGTTIVNITVNNINDKTPEFTTPHYQWHVNEAAPLGYVFGYVNATDGDSDPSLLRYYIYSGGQGKFYLDPLSGAMMVSGLLDRETRDQYDLKLEVYDSQLRGNATATVTVDDANDNCPVFQHAAPLVMYVSEGVAQIDILNLTASDNDIGDNGNVSYFINDTDVSRSVTVFPNGTMYLVYELDHEKKDQSVLNFLVWARDAGSPPCAASLPVRLVVLDVNDNSPEVCQVSQSQDLECSNKLMLRTVSGSPAGTFLAVLKVHDWDESDEGNTSLQFTKDEANLFAFDPLTGVLTLAKALHLADLAARGLLDAGNTTYRAEVLAFDSGAPLQRNTSAELLLHIFPQAPSTPVFLAPVFNFSVPENSANVEVGRVKATSGSEGANISYSVLDSEFFAVNRAGVITTKRPLDRESIDQLAFLVLASSGPAPSDTASAGVLVTVLDENDNPPVFSSPEYDVTVKENIANVTILRLLATDKDSGVNGHLTFTLLNASLEKYFHLEESTGLLLLHAPLDREAQATYTFDVQVQDGALSTRAEVHVTVTDVNDCPPVFTSNAYTTTLDKNSPAAYEVLNVTARDPDEGLNGQVVYELKQRDPVTALFYINELTGTIYNSRKLDIEDGQQVYNLSVIAHDLGTPSLTTEVSVTIYVNNLSDVTPQLTVDPRQVFLVLGTPSNFLVPVNISASFGNVTFAISSGNDENLFSIDSTKGELRVRSELIGQGQYILTIKATNQEAPQYFATAELRVTVTSVQLEQETYAAVIVENTVPPVLLVDIHSNAERAGVPVVYSINTYTDFFYILPESGQLYCNRSLDRERMNEYVIHVTVELKNSLPARQKRDLGSGGDVVVIVKDVNDNPPEFNLTNQVFGILRSAPALTLVTTLKAQDPDDGKDVVVYDVASGDRDIFQVTSEGQVITLVPMNSVTKSSFILVVKATDKQGSGLSTTSSIKILVLSNAERFGLVANMPLATFIEKQNYILRNLSDILGLDVQLEKIEPHQGETVDDSKSDIYFYAFDANDTAVPFDVVQQRVLANSEPVKWLLNGLELLQVTDAPAKVKVEVRYEVGAVEIALLVVSGIIFFACFVAILIVCRSWRKQKELQAREEAATKARQRLERENSQRTDVTHDDADPEEPLELDMESDDGQVFNPRMFLRNVRESEYRQPGRLDLEDQECVMYLGLEENGVNSPRQPQTGLPGSLLEPDLLQTMFDGFQNQTPPQDTAADSGIDQRSGSDNDGGSVSSLDVQQQQQQQQQQQGPAGNTHQVSDSPVSESHTKVSPKKVSFQTNIGAEVYASCEGAGVHDKDETGKDFSGLPVTREPRDPSVDYENADDDYDDLGLPTHPMVTQF